MANDGEIFTVDVIAHRDRGEFESLLRSAIASYQADRLYITVDYQVVYEEQGPANSCGPLYTALVTARRYEDV